MLSADGRYVAFVSSASNLVPGDVNGMADLFVRDRQTGQTTLVSIANDGTQGNDRSSAQPSFSADGRYVAFSSRASNLVPDDTNGAPDVFVAGGVSVDPLAIDVPGGGAQRSVSVSFEYPGTPWTATTTAPWITIAPPAGGSADGIVNFSVAPNTGSARTGTIVAALHTVNVTQVAAPPVASDGFLTTPEDTPISGTLVATNPNGDPITFAIVTPPARGTIVLTNASTGAFTYTPALNRFGGDSFTFRATAGEQSSNVAAVTITVNPVNDAPVASDATLEAVEDTPATGQLIAGDPDSLVVTFVIVTPPAHGTVAIPSPTTSPLGGSYVYTPAPNYHGPDSFTYRVLDGALQSNIATVTIAVAAVNDAPVASSAVVTTQEGVAKTGTLQAADVDGDALTFSIVTPPAKGILTILGYVDRRVHVYAEHGRGRVRHVHVQRRRHERRLVHRYRDGVHRRRVAALAGPDGARERVERRRPGQWRKRWIALAKRRWTLCGVPVRCSEPRGRRHQRTSRCIRARPADGPDDTGECRQRRRPVERR